MQRSIKRTITVVMVLISVLLLVSPVVLARTFVKIDDEGLKNFHIRTDIYKEGSQGGPKHGRVQAVIREIAPEVYSYKFMMDLKKATANTQYSIFLWADLPEEVDITIYGDLEEGIWYFIELYAIYLEIDSGLPDGVIETTVGDLLSALGFTEGTIEQNTGMTFMTNDRGSFKSVKDGIMTEDDAMEHALDIAWPLLRDFLISSMGLNPPVEIDFSYLGITGLWVHGGEYSISGGIKFKGGDPENPTDVYYTETVTIDRVWNDLIWDRGI